MNPIPFRAGLALATTLVFSVFSACSFRDEGAPEQNAVIDTTADTVAFPSAAAMNLALGKGVNFGNALDAPTEGAWGVNLKPEYFRWVADSGFQTVRLPVRWSAHADSNAPYTIDSSFFARVDWAIKQALDNHLNIIVDMHHYEAMMSDPEGQEARFLAMWEQIATRYASKPPQVLFELLNEPRDQLTADKWNTLLVKGLEVVRATNPERTIIVGTAPWGNIDGLANLQVPADSHLIATVHYYEPHNFTHQGADFETGADAWLGTTWRATAPQRNAVDQAFGRAASWSQEHGVPVLLGEFGTYYEADTLSRAMYTEYVSTKAASLGFSWAYWNFSSDFGLFGDTTHVWHNYLTSALLHPGHIQELNDALADTASVDTGSYVVIDDFEDSLPQKTLTGIQWADLYDKPRDSIWGAWYPFFSDSSLIFAPNGDTLLNWDVARDAGLVEENFGKLVGQWGYAGSRGLHLKAHLAGSGYPYLGFEGDFTGWNDSSAFKDFSNLTAISFRAKGHGEWWVDINTDTIQNGYDSDNNWGQFGTHIQLDSTWKLYVIPVEYLVPKAWSPAEADGLVWQDGMRKAQAITFMNGQSYGESPNDELEMWIDDIRLIGIDSATMFAAP